MKFLEDARSLIQRGYYQEALEILDDRLKSKQEISPERLNEYYKCRSVCLAIRANTRFYWRLPNLYIKRIKDSQRENEGI